VTGHHFFASGEEYLEAAKFASNEKVKKTTTYKWLTLNLKLKLMANLI